MGGRMIEVDEELDLRATISVKVRDPGGEDEDIEFIDCEIDVSSHDLDIGNVEVFEREDYE